MIVRHGIQHERASCMCWLSVRLELSVEIRLDGVEICVGARSTEIGRSSASRAGAPSYEERSGLDRACDIHQGGVVALLRCDERLTPRERDCRLQDLSSPRVACLLISSHAAAHAHHCSTARALSVASVTSLVQMPQCDVGARPLK